jgi:hypothetical protein
LVTSIHLNLYSKISKVKLCTEISAEDRYNICLLFLFHDRSAYNSGGVITFRQDADGCRIFEGVTTAQDNGSTTDEDEIAVVRIVRHAKYEVYNRCYSMLGENISATFQQDLQNMIAGDLATMTSVDGALTNDPTTGLLAYSVLVQLSPRSLQLQGKVNIQMTLTPVHAAREIDVTMTIG